VRRSKWLPARLPLAGNFSVGLVTLKSCQPCCLAAIFCGIQRVENVCVNITGHLEDFKASSNWHEAQILFYYQ
jgi:hypothetical protein